MENFTKEHIRSLRTKLEMSQEGFARVLGVSFSTVNRWESGKSHPSQLAQLMLHKLEDDTNNAGKTRHAP